MPESVKNLPQVAQISEVVTVKEADHYSVLMRNKCSNFASDFLLFKNYDSLKRMFH